MKSIDALSPEIQRCIPKKIEKGIYPRFYKLKDGTQSLKWWVKVWDNSGNPVYESAESNRYEDAVKLKKRLISQIESGKRTGGDAGSVLIGDLLNQMLEDGNSASDSTKYIYALVVKKHLLPFFKGIKA